jgi:hypothetical protein
MKTLRLLTLALAFALALALPARADLANVTTLSTSAVATIFIPQGKENLIIILNKGANAVNITIDGGSTYTDLQGPTGNAGVDPTTGATGLGITIPPLANGIPGSYTVTTAPGSIGFHKPIRAIMQAGTTTLSIIVDQDYTPAQHTAAFPTS